MTIDSKASIRTVAVVLFLTIAGCGNPIKEIIAESVKEVQQPATPDKPRATASPPANPLNQIAASVASFTDKHDSLYSQMLACEERYADLLAQATDLESVKQLAPRMNAEADKYAELTEQFLDAGGLTTDKLQAMLQRHHDRQVAINLRVKDQMQRLTENGRKFDVQVEIPHLHWFKVKMDLITEAANVASGKKRTKEQLRDRLEANKEKMAQQREAMKAAADRSAAESADAAKNRTEERQGRLDARRDMDGKARMEEMRQKMEETRKKLGIPDSRIPKPGQP